MKTIIKNKVQVLLVALFLIITATSYASSLSILKKEKQSDDKTYTSFKGKVIDDETKIPLVFASISVEGTNIATVTNTEGGFQIKIPNEQFNGLLKISYMGYENKSISITDLKPEKNNTIQLTMVSVSLTEVSVFPNNPRLLIEKVMENRLKNYHSDPILMQAFYRETIRKRRSYIGLSEAVVDIYKQPYGSNKNDAVELYKGRKSNSVEKMDTLLFKLQGGPYSTLLLDLIKDPYLILSDDVLDNYDYSYVNITRVDGELNYVIEFKQRSYVTTPLFYGKFYINVDNFAISSAFFSLNTENRAEASSMFIKKKPLGVSVYPTSADYLVKYSKKDGVWFYSYARGEVAFKVNWKRKLFNTSFTTMVEMAVTDWEKAEDKNFKPTDKMKMNIIMSDAANGFADKDFWGELNTIEPEKSIESAIKKISKSLKN